jgi:hypothetical protein
LRAEYAMQARDTSWATEQEARIAELITEVGFPRDALDGQVSCRRSLCRFALRMRQNEDEMFALMKLASSLQTKDGLSLAYGNAKTDGERTRIEIYSPREGYLLPDDAER